MLALVQMIGNNQSLTLESQKKESSILTNKVKEMPKRKSAAEGQIIQSNS
jgi:hypothetical protein